MVVSLACAQEDVSLITSTLKAFFRRAYFSKKKSASVNSKKNGGTKQFKIYCFGANHFVLQPEEAIVHLCRSKVFVIFLESNINICNNLNKNNINNNNDNLIIKSNSSCCISMINYPRQVTPLFSAPGT